MSGHFALYQAVGYRSSVVGLYCLTLLLVAFLFGAFDSTTVFVSAAPVESPQNIPTEVMSSNSITGKPQRIVVPSLSLDIPVRDGVYEPTTGSWTLDFNAAYFAIPSKQPNDLGGNTFIYGHSSKRIFGKLWRLKPGAVAEIYTDNGHIFHYSYKSLRTVTPDDVSVFHYRGSPILTLQTCTGSWNELRRMYEFTLERID